MSPVVEYGRKVTIEYTMRFDDGTVADTNVGEEPMVVTQGALDVLPALEEALEGRSAGERFEVTCEPEQGFGERDPEMVEEVDLESIPEDARRIGAFVMAQDPDGRIQEVRVSEVRERTAVLDLNHPAAGRTVHFDVKIIDVE